MAMFQKEEFVIICDGDEKKCPRYFDIEDTEKATVESAVRCGWKRVYGAWLCPSCVSKRDGACEEDR